MRSVILATALLFAVQTLATAAEPADWQGVQVMPRVGAVIKVENRVIDPNFLSLPWKVQNVDGKWLWVGKGWVQRSQVVTLDEAPAYYSQVVKSGRDTAWAYWFRAGAWLVNDDFDKAIADYNQVVRLYPKAGAAYIYRGGAWYRKHDFDKAIADCNEAIRFQPNAPGAYFNRAIAWMEKKEFDKALADCNEFIRLDPNAAMGYCTRGRAWYYKGEFDKAIADYSRTMSLDPNYSLAYHDAAMIRATCTDGRYRNGKKAVELATKACDLSDWKDFHPYISLAAAYAEAGDFDSAVKFQSKAIEMNPNDAEFVLAEMDRLALYQVNKPYREEPVCPPIRKASRIPNIDTHAE